MDDVLDFIICKSRGNARTNGLIDQEGGPLSECMCVCLMD